MKKALILIFLLVAVTAILSSCGASYKDDVTVSSLSDAAAACVEFSGGSHEGDSDFLDYHFAPHDKVDGYKIIASSDGSSISEYGIFHLTGGVNDFEKVCNDYLAKRLERYNGSAANYLPAEYPKLENAEVKVFGNYIVYCILDSTERAAVFNAVEAALKK